MLSPFQCSTASEFLNELSYIRTALELPETEDNWDKIARAIQTLSALTKGGAYKFDVEFLREIKCLYKVIVNSVSTCNLALCRRFS